MFFVVRSNDSFNFPLGLIKYIVIVVIVTLVIALVVGSLCCSGMHMMVWIAASVCSVIIPFHDHG